MATCDAGVLSCTSTEEAPFPGQEGQARRQTPVQPAGCLSASSEVSQTALHDKMKKCSEVSLSGHIQASLTFPVSQCLFPDEEPPS